MRIKPKVNIKLLGMISSRKQFVFMFIVFFLYLCFRFFPEGLKTEFLGKNVSASPRELISVLGLSDSGNYLRAALDIQDFGIKQENRWIFNLWPPGQILLLAILIKLSIPPVFGMGLLLSALWSLAAVLFIQTLMHNKYKQFLVPLFCMAWFTGAPIMGWNQKEGILGSDGISTAIASIAIILILKLGKQFGNQSVSQVRFAGVLIGVLFATISHLRLTFLLAVLFSIVAILFHPKSLKIISQGMRSRKRRRNLEDNYKLEKKFYVSVALTFFLLALPFTLVKLASTGSPTWSSGDYVWGQKWMSDEMLKSGGANFLVEGGSNWACNIDPIKCREIAILENLSGQPYSGFGEYTFIEFRNMAFFAALEHPGSFLLNRLEVTLDTFETLPGSSIGTKNSGFKGWVLTIGFFAVFVCSLFYLRIRNLFLAFILLFCLGLYIPLVFEHFESRYLIPIQAISIILMLGSFEKFKLLDVKKLFPKLNRFISKKKY